MLNTLTVMVQVAPAPRVAPVKLMPVAEAGANTVPPVQLVAALGVCATTKPLGSESVSAAPVSAVLLGLVIAMVKIFAVPAAALAVPVVKPEGLPLSNVRASIALCNVTGSLARKISDAGCELVAGAPPTVAVKAPAAMVLV